jgi:hypothetical protein
MQAPRQMASHKPEADESKSSVGFIEFCCWRAHSVPSWSAGCRFTDGGEPAAVRSPILPFQTHLNRFGTGVTPNPAIVSREDCKEQQQILRLVAAATSLRMTV